MNNIDKAIEKLTKEMMQLLAKEDPFAVPVEEHLTNICTNDIIAGKILAQDKTLDGAIRALWDEAKKRKQGDCAYIPENEAYEIIDKYYGISAEPQPVERKTQKIDIMDLL